MHIIRTTGEGQRHSPGGIHQQAVSDHRAGRCLRDIPHGRAETDRARSQRGIHRAVRRIDRLVQRQSAACLQGDVAIVRDDPVARRGDRVGGDRIHIQRTRIQETEAAIRAARLPRKRSRHIVRHRAETHGPSERIRQKAARRDRRRLRDVAGRVLQAGYPSSGIQRRIDRHIPRSADDGDVLVRGREADDICRRAIQHRRHRHARRIAIAESAARRGTGEIHDIVRRLRQRHIPRRTRDQRVARDAPASLIDHPGTARIELHDPARRERTRDHARERHTAIRRTQNDVARIRSHRARRSRHAERAACRLDVHPAIRRHVAVHRQAARGIHQREPPRAERHDSDRHDFIRRIREDRIAVRRREPQIAAEDSRTGNRVLCDGSRIGGERDEIRRTDRRGDAIARQRSAGQGCDADEPDIDRRRIAEGDIPRSRNPDEIPRHRIGLIENDVPGSRRCAKARCARRDSSRRQKRLRHVTAIRLNQSRAARRDSRHARDRIHPDARGILQHEETTRRLPGHAARADLVHLEKVHIHRTAREQRTGVDLPRPQCRLDQRAVDGLQIRDAAHRVCRHGGIERKIIQRLQVHIAANSRRTDGGIHRERPGVRRGIHIASRGSHRRADDLISIRGQRDIPVGEHRIAHRQSSDRRDDGYRPRRGSNARRRDRADGQRQAVVVRVGKVKVRRARNGARDGARVVVQRTRSQIHEASRRHGLQIRRTHAAGRGLRDVAGCQQVHRAAGCGGEIVH